ncbi:unnamed protein product [Owenia fusiformis]|uniref:Uncharacterized protein n=1 Tax=Owenia fusiformis TaxID=6347 RepID=A0A8S4Q4E2_OWEFU|nr:unnamed protein product [Owenia fusiformis]
MPTHQVGRIDERLLNNTRRLETATMNFVSPLSLWFLAVALLAFVPKTESITAAQKQAIKKGLATGKEILDIIKEQDFKKFLTKTVASNIKSFLGALGPFIGLVMTFVPSADSEELKLMKTMMKEIDTQFDRVDSRFNDVERLIKWTETAVQFGEIQTALTALQEEYRLLYISSAPDENVKYLYIKSYESNYKLAGTKLYQALVTPGGYFNENLGEAVMRYTKNDRRKTNVFLLGIYEMILQAVKLESAYYKMNSFEIIQEERDKEWESRLESIRLKIERFDVDVKYKYYSQSREEIIAYARDNSGMSNEQFSSEVYDLLFDKYYWREWFVLIYNPIIGSDKHRMNTPCGGHILLRQNGRNIVIASQENTTEAMDVEKAHVILVKLIIDDSVGNTQISFNAEEVYYRVDKSIACSFAVVRKDAGVSYKANPSRVVQIDYSTFKIFMFG